MKKTRDASTGPWVNMDDVRAFLSFCAQEGHKWRVHTGLYSDGYQVLHQGHWMALLWNKSWKRYTADRRLSLLVQSFAARKSELLSSGRVRPIITLSQPRSTR